MRGTKFLPLSPFIILSLQACIALTSPSDDFTSGIQFFEQGSYTQALTHFARAEKAGMDNSQLIYNLGSVHYKLEHYQLSKSYFVKLIDDNTLGPVAYYNQGLIEHKLGREDAAIKLFEKCAQSTGDDQLQSLAEKQIITLRNSQN